MVIVNYMQRVEMQAKDLTRGVRRDRRLRAIGHAFDVYWHKWGRWHDEYEGRLRRGYERIYLETEEDRRRKQDEARQACVEVAKLAADHLRTCSCFKCSGYKKYEKTPHQIRARHRDAEDLTFLWAEPGENFDTTLPEAVFLF